MEEPQAGVLMTLKGLPSGRQATFRIPREELLELLDAVPELTAPRPRRRFAPPALAAAASPAGET